MGQRSAGPYQLAQPPQRGPRIGQVVERGVREYGVKRLRLQRVSQDVAVAPRHRRLREPGPGPAEHRGVAIDGHHERDTPREPGREETITAAHVEDGLGRGGNAGGQPRVVMDVGIPRPVHAPSLPVRLMRLDVS